MTYLVKGVGINDAEYVVNPTINGIRVPCKIYLKWKNMLERCYCEKFHKRNPAYIGCTVCKEWLTFSNFKAWIDAQDWEGKEIDKDLLFIGNKIYSPDRCIMVSITVNSFLKENESIRGKYPIGVYYHKASGFFRARCRNPFSGIQESLISSKSVSECHQAWRKRKHELALQLADLQDDPRVASALRTRYLPS